MRGFLLTTLLLTASAAMAQPLAPQAAPAPAPAQGVKNGAPYFRNRLYVSPMGEPFRSGPGEPDPQDLWFQQADTNHDGALSFDEFSRDATRFFAVLDRGHDGEIDPDDIDYYESILLPEIRVDAMQDQGYDRGDAPDSENGDDHPTTTYTRSRLGAARFGNFDFPEPVTIADTNLNRGVDPMEWQRAATKRFDILDINHDGKIERAELPRVDSERTGGGKRKHHR